MTALLLVGLGLVVVVLRGRLRRRADRADALLVSRDDRTAWNARTPGRWRGSGLL